MSSTVLLLVLFCGLTLAQDGANKGEVTVEIQSCFPDMCKFLVEFGAMKEKQRAMETKLQQTETKLQQREMKMKETENQLVELKSKGNISPGATKVAFSAAVSGTGAYGPFDTDVTLIYGRVILNMGDAYNQNTGIFTAPVAGVYYFSFIYHAGGEHKSQLYLYKNAGVMAAAYEHPSQPGTSDGGGNAVFLQLQQGDQVFVKLAAKSHVWEYDHYTTFSGFLVTET